MIPRALTTALVVRLETYSPPVAEATRRYSITSCLEKKVVLNF